MPRQTSSMRKIRDALRQKWTLGLSMRSVARSVRLSRPAVSSYLHSRTPDQPTATKCVGDQSYPRADRPAGRPQN